MDGHAGETARGVAITSVQGGGIHAFAASRAGVGKEHTRRPAPGTGRGARTGGEGSCDRLQM